MPLRDDPTLAGFDVEAALRATRDAAGDGLLSFVEFTPREYHIVFVDDAVVDLYRDEDHLREHYGQVLSHLNMDFLERDTYEQALLPNAGSVRALVTLMDEIALLRVLVGDEGLYIALGPDVEVQAVTDAIRDAVGADAGAASDESDAADPGHDG